MCASGSKFKRFLHVSVAGLHGNRIYAATYRRGGRPAYAIHCADVDEPTTQGEEELVSSEVEYKIIEAYVGEYEASGHFTEAELRTIRSLWLEREPMRVIAQREGVSRQAILARIEGTRGSDGRRWGGLLKKAPALPRSGPC